MMSRAATPRTNSSTGSTYGTLPVAPPQTRFLEDSSTQPRPVSTVPLVLMRARPLLLVPIVATICGALLVFAGSGTMAERTTATASGPYSITRAKSPPRSIVRDAGGAWVATFTDRTRTVALAGPVRRFEEAAANPVASTTWVRTLAVPFAGTVDVGWLDRARADRSPDVLATALQYVAGSSDRTGASGLLIAGDASYGPFQPNRTRKKGADWNDFQGVLGVYGTTVDPPEPEQLSSLDCSGFVRMLWGVRFGIPLVLDPDGGASLPRRSAQQASSAPGIVPISNAAQQVTEFGRLQAGDLVFFDASGGSAIDHVGVYLGLDTAGHRRFISSRKSADGPTMGDLRGASLLDGTGLYARSFRSTRRL